MKIVNKVMDGGKLLKWNLLRVLQSHEDRLSTLEGGDPSDSLLYDDTALKARIKALEDADLDNRIKALEDAS